MRTDQSSLRSALAGLSAHGAAKFQAAKELVALSEQEPDALYPAFDAIARLLEAENNLIKWSAFQMMANLAIVDRDHRIRAIIGRYLAPISGPVMITAGHAIHGSAKIARADPSLTGEIIRAILGVEHARYKTDECRNIAIGHAITALGSMSAAVRKSAEVTEFVTRQMQNSRPATRKKAARFLKETTIPPAA
jgi:hypothetical protein